ncbi:hypothetical protein GKZ89_04930 [Bacillus mangrovi]|uniref:Magnesium transporter MgtE intracellular domain-containing protein n=1 Tax=Metabacillus mangrovi TaxID=1491830 RepID=A0A7X2S3B3_9BACI|nr:MotE family protein [Metabacillus mangrovi]MTH52745.1 hypothetical protein [Metabacillus mangrovi]
MENKKEYGKFQWFLFVIFIPLVFTLTLTAVILSMAGVDVGKTAIDAISAAGGTKNSEQDEKPSSPASSERLKNAEDENGELTKQLSIQEQEIDAMENDVLLKEKKIAGLTKEVEDLKAQLDAASSAQSGQKDITKLYEDMSSSKAAEILPLLGEEDAMKILQTMKDAQVTDILEKMTPEEAAMYTGKLADNKGGE